MTAYWYACLALLVDYGCTGIISYMRLVHSNEDLMKQFVNSRIAFSPEVLQKISSRITNDVAGINRGTYSLYSVETSGNMFSNVV